MAIDAKKPGRFLMGDGTPEPPPPPAAGPDEEPGKPIRCLPESVTPATINQENRRYWKTYQ